MRCTLMRGDEVVAKLNSEDHVSTNTIRPRKEFARLKSNLGVKEETKKEKPVRYEIKTRDDVHLRASLRGHRKSKDIDKEARRKEAIIDMNTEKIPVSFDKTPEPVDESTFKPSLVKEEPKEKDEKPGEGTGGIRIQFSKNYINLVKELYDTNNVSLVAIKENGEIWDTVKDELIGYSNKDCNPSEDEDTDKPSDEKEVINDILDRVETEEEPGPTTHVDEVVYRDSDDKTTIGTLAGEQLSVFAGDSNYKTDSIASPIPNHFAVKDTSVRELHPEPEDENNDETETRKIPQLVIHPRKETTEDLKSKESDQDQIYLY